MDNYGKELILDLHDCNVSIFNRVSINDYFVKLCMLIDMERGDLHFWDYEDDPEGYEKASPHLKGISAVQFIMTSSIVLHSLDDLKKVFIDIFSCKDFEVDEVIPFTEAFFGGNIIDFHVIDRL